jgi:hypothetical protein
LSQGNPPISDGDARDWSTVHQTDLASKMFLTLCLDDSAVETTRRFYGRLGYDFLPEKHGKNGLEHYAAPLSSVTVEVYPAIRGLPATDRFFIGVLADSPAALKADLIETFQGSEPHPPVPTTKSGIATLRDPNGILVRLFPKT